VPDPHVFMLTTRKSSRLLVGLTLACLFNASPCMAQSRAASETELKAAFVFNFARFVEWPSSAFDAEHGAFRICVAGSAPMADLLDEVTADKMVDGRKVQVRRVKSSDSKLRECHILLVESGSPESFVEATHDSSVLTVGNGTQFIEKGGMVDFINEHDTIRFEINPDLPQRLQLKISSKLLALARLVRTTQP